MPEVPDFNMQPLKHIYCVNNPNGKITKRQRELIETLCKRRKSQVPDMHNMTRKQAAELIGQMFTVKWWLSTK
jgi:hypothetical protein